MKDVVIKTLDDLDAFAREFAATLRGGDVVGLVGELGAGKTAFVQALSRALGVKDDVRSPTFILMQTFRTGAGAKKRGLARLCHVDAYRLENYAELVAIGFDEFADDPHTATFVEWSDRAPELHRRPGFRELTFSFGHGGARHIRF